MANQADAGQSDALLMQILFNPLSYVHPLRLGLPDSVDAPRQRAIVNRLLLAGAPDLSPAAAAYSQRLLQHWWRLPYLCALVGVQLLKPDLGRCGRSLRLPAPVRSFMALPLKQMIVASDDSYGLPDWRADADPLRQVQRAGLVRILDWQRQAPAALLVRVRLLFPAQLDRCFEGPRKSLQAGELFLISQAIHYAKDNPYHV